MFGQKFVDVGVGVGVGVLDVVGVGVDVGFTFEKNLASKLNTSQPTVGVGVGVRQTEAFTYAKVKSGQTPSNGYFPCKKQGLASKVSDRHQ
jgi:hypothetical protein